MTVQRGIFVSGPTVRMIYKSPTKRRDQIYQVGCQIATIWLPFEMSNIDYKWSHQNTKFLIIFTKTCCPFIFYFRSTVASCAELIL